MIMEKEIYEINLDDILPNRFKPRLSFDQTSLNELAESIREHGIIQPLVVRKLGDKYEIIAGERRYKAATLVGLRRVPVIVMDLDDNKSAEIAIVENIQRKEMTALEEAKSYKKLLDRGYLTQEQLAVRMGKSQSSIANKLRLLNLSTDVQEALLNERISERHARSLLQVNDETDQKNILNEIISRKLTVKQTDELIKSKKPVIEKLEIKETKTPQIKRLEPIMPNEIEETSENPQMDLINKLNRVNNNDENRENSFNIDLDNIKNTAKDISQPVVEKANIDELMKNEVEEKIEQRPKNKFLLNLDGDNEFDFFDVEEEKTLDIGEATTSIAQTIRQLEEKGYKISKEEFDFEDIHQFIIRIQKK